MNSSESVKNLFDYHLHTGFSEDSDTPPEDMIKSAIQKGLASICITDHHDPDFPGEGSLFFLDTDAYYPRMAALQEEYRDRIDIRIGVEIGLQPHLADYFTEYLSRYPFDFVIGSTHVVRNMDPYYPAYFQGREEQEAYLEYFQTVYDNLQAFPHVDVCGHLDYIVRYGPHKNACYSYRRYQEILDAILQLMVEKQIGLEVNTGGFKDGLGTTNPIPEIIGRYLELGGERITLGSDAHTPEVIAHKFPTALSLLREWGVNYLCTFSHREPVFHRI